MSLKFKERVSGLNQRYKLRENIFALKQRLIWTI